MALPHVSVLFGSWRILECHDFPASVGIGGCLIQLILYLHCAYDNDQNMEEEDL